MFRLSNIYLIPLSDWDVSTPKFCKAPAKAPTISAGQASGQSNWLQKNWFPRNEHLQIFVCAALHEVPLWFRTRVSWHLSNRLPHPPIKTSLPAFLEPLPQIWKSVFASFGMADFTTDFLKGKSRSASAAEGNRAAELQSWVASLQVHWRLTLRKTTITSPALGMASSPLELFLPRSSGAAPGETNSVNASQCFNYQNHRIHM